MPLGAISAGVGPGEVFALLDDAQARTNALGDDPVSRLYTDFSHERTCRDPAALDVFWDSVEGDLALGLHAVVAIDYEWGVALQGGSKTPLRPSGLGADADGDADGDSETRVHKVEGAERGVFRVLLFRSLDFLCEEQVLGWLVQAEARALRLAPSTLVRPAPAGLVDVKHSVTASEFEDAIAQIHAALARGDCYQINYTFRLTFGVFGHPLSLYRRMRERQPASYGALISTASGWSLSASPELFLRHRSGQLLAQPMKGTAVRERDPLTDAVCGAALQADPKNRAENVMIVDLLRNDLSKLAIPGGVHVDKLFAVHAWPTVWQMTSDVKAALRPNIRFPDVLRALYPCGSITGAPKHAAMGLIDALETTERGLYTGAIGWFDRFAGFAAGFPEFPDVDSTTGLALPHASGDHAVAKSGIEANPEVTATGDAASHAYRCGDFCLSVAIRTVTIDPPQLADASDIPGAANVPEARLALGRAGIGAGIVLDSNAASEHEECLLKSRFLTEADPGFALIETLLAEDRPLITSVGHACPHHHLPLRARHLHRLAAASARLGFRCDLVAVNAALDHALLSIRQRGSHRVRLTLNKRGEIECAAWPMRPLSRDPAADGAGAKVADAVADGLADGVADGASPVTVLLASDYGFGPIGMTSPGDAFLLAFKTTHRVDYDCAWQQAETYAAFDMIFTNAAGKVTEGGRSNLLVKLAGEWFTPPVKDGLLAGVMRGVLMDDPRWAVRERHLDVSDLVRAESLVVCNALRGAVPAVLRRA